MKPKNVPEKMVGLGLGAIALVVYVATLSQGAFPGQSSTLVVTHSGLFPKLSPSSPLWTLLVAFVRMVSGEHFVTALNLSSAICAAAVVVLMYNLVREGVTIFIDELGYTVTRRRIAASLAGVGASLCLAFCIPFWMVANRAHVAAFDLLLLLVAARLLLAYMDYGRLWIALVFSLLFGLGVVEFATFIVMAPLFGAWLLYVMWKREVLRVGAVLSLIGCAVFGLSAYFLSAWAFYGSEGYELRGYDGFFNIVWHSWRAQYLLIARSLPKEGWLIILFMSVVPWFAVFSVAKRGLNDERDWGLYILHATMTAIAVAVVLNARISPFAMMGTSRLLVTPYVLVAMVFGYLVAYWFLLPSGWGRDPEGLLTQFWRKWFGWIVILPLFGILVWAPIRNCATASARDASLVTDVAEEVVDSLAGREWLVTDGVLDNHLLLVAGARGIPLKLINVAAGDSSVYLDYLASQFEQTRMQNLAKIGVSALLKEWLRSDPDVCSKLAVFSIPDFWRHHGFKEVPNRLLFLGSKAYDDVDLDACLDRNREFWKEYQVLVSRGEEASSGSHWYGWVKRHAGLVANNLGVVLEEQGRVADALGAYRASRRMDADNVSALLNMASLVESGQAVDEDGSIREALEELEAESSEKFRIWSLARYYGYVRSPHAFADLGWSWARSGQPGMAISELERAEAMLPEDARAGVQQMMADLFLRDNRPDEGSDIYEEILERDPENQAALLGMARIAISRRQQSEANEYLERAEASGVPAEHIGLQRAGLAFVSGELERARELLEPLLRDNRKLLRGWVLLADVAFAEKDSRAMDKCERRLVGIEGERGYFVSLIRGRRSLDAGDLRSAARLFEIALSHTPTDWSLMAKVMQLELVLGRKEPVRRRARLLLRNNPDHSLALYVLGTLQVADEELELAEDSLRHCLRGYRMPVALNDLAWVLQLRGEYEEAESLINEALEKQPRNHSMWDTKGVILLRTDRYEEAADAFGRSLAIFGKVPSVHLHMGEAQLALGNMGQVKQIVELLSSGKDSLSSADRETLSRLAAAVDQSRNVGSER
jgi:tetratricopeptide (TPR) repeat protein